MNNTIFKYFVALIIGTISLGFISNDLKISNINRSNYVVERLMMKKQYIDRRFKIMKFPSFLVGSQFIKTANDDKFCKGKDFLTFNVNKDVSVFVAHWSDIKIIPDWLKNDFQKTNLILNSGDLDYFLYKKDFPAGTISLGGNVVSDNEDPAMYSVIVTEKIEIPQTVEYITNDYSSLLKKFSSYDNSDTSPIPDFEYQNPNAPNLIKLKKQLPLESIVDKQNNEISKIIALMKWVNQHVKHDGSNNLKNKESLKIIEYCNKTEKGVNCRDVAIVLNDIYLAMGFKARIVSCLPNEDYDTENHVTNLVFSKSLNKWIYMDPSFSAYLTNDKGLILNHSEIRQALISGDSLIVKGGLVHNGDSYGEQENYLSYMTKNLFRFSCPLLSAYGYENSDLEKTFVYLNPVGYKNGVTEYNKKIKSGENNYEYFTQNNKLFWRKPENKK